MRLFAHILIGLGVTCLIGDAAIPPIDYGSILDSPLAGLGVALIFAGAAIRIDSYVFPGK